MPLSVVLAGLLAMFQQVSVMRRLAIWHRPLDWLSLCPRSAVLEPFVSAGTSCGGQTLRGAGETTGELPSF